ncbi:MAG: hypothetical protein IRZ06_00590 [Nevskia sp.]|nr:hypothetical protein [Nevskia sp.]
MTGAVARGLERTVDGLGYAATPVFALMALWTLAAGREAMTLWCSGAPRATFLGGMAPMYGLMSLFHSAPWLKHFSRRRARAGPS